MSGENVRPTSWRRCVQPVVVVVRVAAAVCRTWRTADIGCHIVPSYDDVATIPTLSSVSAAASPPASLRAPVQPSTAWPPRHRSLLHGTPTKVVVRPTHAQKPTGSPFNSLPNNINEKKTKKKQISIRNSANANV